jgi:hypothetical protein
MPSPFPGMDPYLEDPEFFPGLHDSFIIYLCEFLQPRLPEPYFVRPRARVWVEYTNRVIEPDVNLLRGNRPSAGPAEEGGMEGAVAVALRTVAVPNDETREPFLEIHTVQGDRQLVTAIEVLSPNNKRTNSEGRMLYLEKQREVLNSRVNLVEIDLLRGGEHTTAVPREDAVAAAGPFDYHVCVRKMDDLRRLHVYAVPLHRRLPEIVIPLLPGDGGVKADLQAVFDRCYDIGGHERLSPYRDHTPEPPLTPEQAAWATQLLRAKGLLPPP